MRLDRRAAVFLTDGAGSFPATCSSREENRSGSQKRIVCALEYGKMIATTKRESRKSVRQSAWITLDGGFAVRPCVVIDLSARGAKISVDDADAASAGFRLAFSRDARTGHQCKVIWRSGKMLGVRFIR